jgi:hypothetical protein
MIRTITEKARAMMIDSQVPVQFWGEAVNTAVYLHQRSPNEGLKRNNDRDGYQAPYETPYEILHGLGKRTHNADGKKISYQASVHNLCRFRCYASRLIPEVHRRGKSGLRSKPCMMVGYTHNSKTLWRLWDPEFQRVKAQSEVVIDEETNAHMPCQHESNEIGMFELPEDKEYIKETDTGDKPLRVSQPTQIGKSSVSNGSNPLVRFRVRVGTGTEPWQRFYHMKNPHRWHLGRFPPQNPAIASPDVSLQLSI